VIGDTTIAGVGTVGCAAVALRCPAGPAAVVTAPCAGGLRFGGRFHPPRHPVFFTPTLLACAFRKPPFRGYHLLSFLLVAMSVFPLFLHIFMHVLYLTCFHPCALTRLVRVYRVLDYAPMSPRHILPRFSFAFCRHCVSCPAFSFTFSYIPLLCRFLHFFLWYAPNNMFREIPTVVCSSSRHRFPPLPPHITLHQPL
jgi:hypothetical protein